MVKRVVGGAVGALVLGSLLWGTSFFGYLRTAKDEIQRAADDLVSVEFKLANCERMVRDLNAEIPTYSRVVATNQQAVDTLNKSVAKRESDMKELKEQIIAQNNDLKRGERQYVYSGKSFTADQVTADLERKVKAFKAAEEGLKRERDLLAKQDQARLITESRFEKMVSSKKDLEAQVEQLKLRVEMMKADKAVSTLVIDDSAMSRAQKAINDLNAKLDVEERARAIAGATDESPIKVPTNAKFKDVSSEIDSLFGEEAKAKTEL